MTALEEMETVPTPVINGVQLAPRPPFARKKLSYGEGANPAEVVVVVSKRNVPVASGVVWVRFAVITDGVIVFVKLLSSRNAGDETPPALTAVTPPPGLPVGKPHTEALLFRM
jgi:hypothetical protein